MMKLMYLGSFCIRGEIGLLNFDYICMCVVNKQFELLEFVLTPLMLTCSMMREKEETLTAHQRIF